MWILNGLMPNAKLPGACTRVGDDPFTKSQIDSVPEWPRARSVLAGATLASRPAGDQGETRKESDLSSRTRMG